MTIELDHLRTFRAADAAPDAGARAAARAALLERIAATAVVPAGSPARRRVAAHGWRPPLLAGALGLVAVAVTAMLVALLAGVGSRGVEPEAATAAELLRRAAAVAAEGPDPVLRRGQYWYTRSESLTRATVMARRSFAYLVHIRREAWIGREGGGRVRQYAVGHVRFLTPHDRAAWAAAGRPTLGRGLMDVPLEEEDGSKPNPYHLGATQLTYAQLRALPTGTGALYALVAREARANHNSHGAPHEMFTIVGDMLRETPIPPPLRAAFFRVAARIPGVELVGAARDASGRPGVAVALDAAREHRELIFDAHTAALLGERELDADGRPLFVSAYLRSGVVETTRERPAKP